MKSILIFLVLLISSALSQAQDIAGDWQGTLSAGGAELRLVLHIVKAPDNNLKARWQRALRNRGTAWTQPSLPNRENRLPRRIRADRRDHVPDSAG